MSTNITTKAEFSRMCKVTKPGIAKAISSGKVQLLGKKVNLDHRITAEYYYSKTGKVLNPSLHAIKPKKPKTTGKKAPVEPITTPTENDDVLDLPPDDGYKLPPGIKCFEDITIHNVNSIPADLMKKFKELEVAKKAKQDRDVKRGELIKRELVKSIFAQIHTVDTNQWKTLEDKIMPELCGMFEVQDGGPEAIKARKLISEEVSKILRFVKRQIDEFFADNEGDNPVDVV